MIFLVLFVLVLPQDVAHAFSRISTFSTRTYHSNLHTFTRSMKLQGQPQEGETGRREACQRAVGSLMSTIFITSSNAHSAGAAVLQSGSCASGYGDSCEDLAEGNEYIRSLQMRSAQKRDVYAKEALDAYYMKNYPDVLASSYPPKFLVKKPDGSYAAFTGEEISQLQRSGKLKLENPKAMGGKVTDLTQKPVMVLKETE